MRMHWKLGPMLIAEWLIEKSISKKMEKKKKKGPVYIIQK